MAESTSQTSTRVLKCPMSGCQWQYESGFSEEFSFQLITMHVKEHTVQQSNSTTIARAPKLNPPSIDAGVDQEVWQAFKLRWRQYCQASNIGEELQSLQLFDCASESLGNLLLKSNPNITDSPPDVVMMEMEKLAVIHLAKGVVRGELMRMSQGNDEPIRTFAAKVQGKAQTCGFMMHSQCKCGSTQPVDYTSEVIKDVILAGICDSEIKMSILGIEEIEEKSVNDLIALIERKEKARKAYTQSEVAAMSSFKRSQTSIIKQPSKMSPKIPCPVCKHLYRRYNGRNTKPFEFCIECFRKRRKREPAQSNNSMTTQCDDESVAALLQDKNVSKVHVFNQFDNNDVASCDTNSLKRWLCNFSTREHPKLNLRISMNKSKFIPVICIADTGAQSNVWGMSDFLRAGFKKCDLEGTSMKITAANNNGIPIAGRFLADIEGDGPGGEIVSCKAMIYISESVSGLFISFDTLISLNVVSNHFPVIGCCVSNKILETNHAMGTVNAPQLIRIINSGCPTQPCSCPLRSSVPNRPLTLPFQPTVENIDKMRAWLLKFFESSTFNTCPHQPLQKMSGPPIEIHIDSNAKPRVCHIPARISLHWQDQVLQDIKRDQALGILEEVPYGEPAKWCHRMVVTRKQDGRPRRTVDLSPLNKYCKRETHTGDSPFHLARRIPPNVWKTVCDAWNGYHSVPLRESDKHLTTFITPYGRYRYRRAPQGFLSSGDGYNRRFSAILEGFQQVERCIDDTIFYDRELENHWWRTIDFLIRVGKSGIVLNQEKFQFCQKEVAFAGFRIANQRVEPLPKYLNAIRMFPTPRTSTDIRSWFGLVNQLSSYAPYVCQSHVLGGSY